MNEKIELSGIKKADLSVIVKWRNNPDILKFNTQYFLLNMEHQKKWFDEINQKESKSKMFVFKYKNKIVGVGGLIHIDNKNKNADIAISILEIFLNINRVFLNFNFTKINKLFVIDFSSKEIM